MPRLFFIAALLLSFPVVAQEFSVTGVVNTTGGDPKPDAMVSLLRAVDSSWINTVLTDAHGAYAFRVSAGEYIVDIQMLGHHPVSRTVRVLDNVDIPVLVLALQAENMDALVVKGKRKYIVQQQGKTVLNVEGSVGATGISAYDLLRKSPGVSFDMEGNILLQGKQGVLVLIDDRPTYLAGKELEDYLKSITAGNIAQLELITQPSAKYDAAGNAGVVNIRLKEQKERGLNGNIATSMVQGVYLYTPHNATVNYNRGKYNLYATAGYFLSTSYLNTATDRELLDDDGVSKTTVISDYRAKETFSDYALKLGADYTLNEKYRTGVMVNGIYHPNEELDIANSTYIDNSTGKTYNNLSLTDQGLLRKRVLVNAYLSYAPGSGKTLLLNADGLYHSNVRRQYTSSTHYDISPGLLPVDEHFRNKQPLIIKAASLKADYNHELTTDCKLEAGFKAGYVQVDADARFDVYIQDWRTDTMRSNHFIYNENINAAYASLHKDIGKRWKLQAGLRAEQANIEGLQLANTQSFTRTSISLFPTAFVTHIFNEQHKLDINYGRRLERPSYRLLDPFRDYKSQYLYETGNPELLPLFTHNIQLKHYYRDFITTGIHLSKATGIFNHVFYAAPATGIAYSMPENIASSTSAGMSLEIYRKLVDKLEMTFSANSTYRRFHNSQSANDSVAVGWNHSFNLDTTLTLHKGWAIEAHGNYSPAARTGLQNAWGPWLYYSMGFSKKILKDAGDIKVNIADPTHSAGTWSSTANKYVRSYTEYEWNTRQVTLAFSYRFGGKNAGEQKRSTMDETGRM